MTRVIPSAVLAAVLLLAGLSVGAQTPYPALAPSPLPGLEYGRDIYPAGADHDPEVPNPDAFLGFPVGQRTATPEQVVAYARAVAEASPRVELVEYTRSYEGRPLVYLVISSPANLARQDEIKAGMQALADPRDTSAAERARLVESLPGVAWLAYSIHGNESSGSDASLAVIHHLAADRSAATRALLEELVIIVDPSMNPDGRARFVKGLTESRGTQPNVDDQSVLHTGYWPYGRGNHYLFDLNRDWIYARHPETRGRIPEIAAWRPLLFVDAHEMGAQDTYLFSPAREPHNPHLPPYRRPMGNVFADDQAAAFDRYGYPYYSGEWHEDWYPGYSDAWAALRGAQGILYEQARLAEDGVQRHSQLISYRQSVHHQVISSFANLETLRRERQNLLEAFSSDRAEVASARGPYGNRSFVILPTDNQGRLDDLLDLARVQGFEVHRLTRELRVGSATDQLGRELRSVDLPAGSLVLRNRQPEGRLLAAMFEFDPRMSDTALANERERILKEGRSTIYDTTGWNISMMFGLEALEVPQHLDSGLERVDLEAPSATAAVPADSAAAIALAVSGADDRSLAFAGRMMERGYFVRASRKASRLDDIDLPIGSIAVTLDDNRGKSDWQADARTVARELGLALHAISHGRAPGELADLGGQQWRLLVKPNIALVSRGMTNMLDYGATWYALDHRLGIRHSHLDEGRIGAFDLRRYNVIYLPERWSRDGLPAGLSGALEEWVRAGGTLIAVGNSARALMSGDEPLVNTRPIEAVIGEELAEYQDAIYREWLAAQPLPAAESTWGRAAVTAAEYPWDGAGELPEPEARKRVDSWQSMLMPSGAIVATRVDTAHWLAAGTGDVLPVLFSNSPVLMSSPPVEAPFRIGVYDPADVGAATLNWAPVPAGQEVRVRMSGLLWPEARTRIASAAWVTRESVGRGQVILFASAPAFRAAQLGAMRVLENVLVLGPGMGTSQPVPLP
ncbi:M14 family zinc carboxypeptidase [Thioalkalivibrio sp. XN279]|uniref:M14 family zinc carboxypeptidase n=1 Tax=Thioalkalivibrio sp. XN279 TaxID=2714953 RepID=UPI001409F8B6|nr:M14 family zinc carboxypeptidase [Thioalkalivibrio sp. XN279]NHA15876.1 peptidase [Thioalkalivibrio sp. XN279]